MANENDNINNDGANKDAEHHEEHKHHSWLEKIEENIEEHMDRINTEFPLSGGETEEDFQSVDDSEEGDKIEASEETSTKAPEKEEQGKESPKEEKKHEHHSFMERIIDKIQNLDSDFPLSGGEEE